MRLLVAAVLLSVVLLCLGCGQDLDITPTPKPLRVTLGGKPPDTWESLKREIRELEAEGRELNDRLQAGGHIIAPYLEDREEWHSLLRKMSYSDRKKIPTEKKTAAKLWPWPIQTQVAKLDKEFERVEAQLLLMDTPTPDPDWTPTPTVTPTPTRPTRGRIIWSPPRPTAGPKPRFTPTVHPWLRQTPRPMFTPLPTIPFWTPRPLPTYPVWTPRPTWTPTLTPTPRPTLEPIVWPTPIAWPTLPVWPSVVVIDGIRWCLDGSGLRKC